MKQTIGFVNSEDGTRLAYAVAGDGPSLPLVRTPTIATHVELDQDGLMWGHYWRFLADGRSFVRYDGRGSGLSDRAALDFSLDARVQDLEAVVNGLKLARFDLLGHGMAACVALEYAARNPARISRLIVLNGMVHGPARRGGDLTAYSQMIRGSRGFEGPTYDRLFASTMIPGGSKEEQTSVMELVRSSVTPEVAASMTEAGGNIDIVDRIAAIGAPTLVAHCVRSFTAPLAEGRLLASMLPNARFVSLESENQVLFATEPAWQTFKDEVGAFLASDGIQQSSLPVIEGLSARESQVLRRVAEGATDSQIAHELEISVRTVGNHVNNVLKKTESASRAQAALWAAKKGFL